LGSSFAFLAPIAGAMGANKNFGAALGGVVVTGVILALVGLIVKAAGTNWINLLLPPVVTGTIVMVIGLNLAGAAKGNFSKGPLDAIVTLGAIALIAAISKGFMARISIFLGIAIGYTLQFVGDVNFDGVKAAKWFALPDFTSPTFSGSAIVLFLPVVLVLIAENVGHVKAVSTMTGKNLDDAMGDALLLMALEPLSLASVAGFWYDVLTQRTLA
jgi:xanthine/uracil permease